MRQNPWEVLKQMWNFHGLSVLFLPLLDLYCHYPIDNPYNLYLTQDIRELIGLKNSMLRDLQLQIYLLQLGNMRKNKLIKCSRTGHVIEHCLYI